MKLVVTGATGHIGSYLIRDLARRLRGSEIVLVDNLMTQRVASLFDLPTGARYRFVEADVTTADLRPILDKAHAVIHLAAITDVAGSVDNGAQIEANNLEATRRVTDACAQTGARLIAVSTTSVYTSPRDVVTEDCPPDELNRQSPYTATKLKEEALVRCAAGRGLSAVSCRFGTIFGASPGMRFHTAVNRFCWQAVMGQPLTVWRTAYEQKRPYLDLHDAARVFAFILDEDLFDGGVYNVLTTNSTVREVVAVIREFIPRVELSFIDHPLMNALSYDVSCERFVGKGFRFEGDLRRGIGETIARLRRANSA
jgi:nucleoside-diphosphate-sugar epimerase